MVAGEKGRAKNKEAGRKSLEEEVSWGGGGKEKVDGGGELGKWREEKG